MLLALKYTKKRTEIKKRGEIDLSRFTVTCCLPRDKLTAVTGKL